LPDNEKYIKVSSNFFINFLMEKRLKIGEVVWAKIRGFPWWPAVVRK
jgi:hypothetical protein